MYKPLISLCALVEPPRCCPSCHEDQDLLGWSLLEYQVGEVILEACCEVSDYFSMWRYDV